MQVRIKKYSGRVWPIICGQNSKKRAVRTASTEVEIKQGDEITCITAIKSEHVQSDGEQKYTMGKPWATRRALIGIQYIFICPSDNEIRLTDDAE
jgi:hypothetical protein